MKAAKEVGFARIIKFSLSQIFLIFINLSIFPPIRSALLKLAGAKIGKNSIVLNVSLINLDRTGLKGLIIGDDCFIGDEVLLDLAGSIEIENGVTIAARSVVMTHLNVGYRDHPLQKHFPPVVGKTTLRSGSFLGANSLVLPNVTIGKESFVAAGSVVTKDVSAHSLVAGSPAEAKRSIAK